MFRKDFLKVPLQIIEFVNQHKLYKAFGLYLALKIACNGHLVLDKQVKTAVMKAAGIRSNTSFLKYVQDLRQLNWIGVDEKTNTYYVRGFNALRRRHKYYHPVSAIFSLEKDARDIKLWAQGAILNGKVRQRLHARQAVAIKHLGPSSAWKKERALQELVNKGLITPYIGLSVGLIGELLGVSRAQGDRLKKQLQEAGYIKCKAKYKVIATTNKPHLSLYAQLPSNRHYSIKIRRRKGIKYYEYRERSYDEIINCMEFTNQRSIIRRIKHENKRKIDLGMERVTASMLVLP